MSVPSEWYERSECTFRCRSKACVADLNKLITKCSRHELREYLLDNCPSSVRRADSYGRTPVHLAASTGRVNILSWLLEILHCDVNARDGESAWTALHRAVYYGRLSCAALLIEHGADMSLRDKDGMTALDIATLDSSPWVKHLQHSRLSYEMPCELNAGDPSELYTWGINDNFTLAQGNPKGSKFPEVVEFFVKRRIGIKQVAMSKFHSVFVSVSGSVCTCGHGEGGRLGTGHQQSSLEPQQMVLTAGTGINVAAVGSNHTVLVTDSGQLFTCGLNKHRVLGLHNQPDRILVPTRVLGPLKDKCIVNCAAGMFHTVALTSNGALFTFGTNAGQLGHAKGNIFVVQPRQVSGVYKEDDAIACVHACDSATVLATKQGIVYLLQNYICRKIMTKQLGIEKVQVGGGRLDTSSLFEIDQRLASIHNQLKDESLNILIRKKSGDLIAWSKEHNRIDRCNFNVKQSLLFKDIALCNYGHTALMITNTGLAYMAKYGNWRAPKGNRKLSTSASSNIFKSCLDMLDADSVQEFVLEQLSCIFRAHTAALGPKAKSGAVLQCEPRNFLTEVPLVGHSILSTDMKKLLENVNENDSVHDLVIVATNYHGQCLASFPCHQYVLSARSEFFKKLIQKKKGDDVKVKEDCNESPIHSPKVYRLLFRNCDPNVLRNVLEFAYSETCQILCSGVKIPALEKDTDSSDVNITWESAGEENNNGMLIKENSDVAITGCESAFEIYQISKDSKTNKSMQSKKGKKLAKARSRNFIAEVKALVKKVGLPHSNLFDLATVENGTIKVKESWSTYSLSFHPQKCLDLLDIELECDDGVILAAHKCILVARIEFFRSMLLSSWAETRGKIVKVPIPSDVFKHILDFVYTASVSRINTILSVDLLCEIMAASDQLLLDRLKEVAEVQVASLLTLKNVAAVIEIANIFNCEQLKSTCEQFVCHHLPALLHTANFFSLDYEALDKLEVAYRASIPGITNRIIPPSDEAPDVSYIEPEESDRSDADGFSSSFELPYIDELMSTSPPKRKQSFGKQKNRKKSSLPKSITQGITLSELLTQRQSCKVYSISERSTIHPVNDVMNDHSENEGIDKFNMEREDAGSAIIRKEEVLLVGTSGQPLLPNKQKDESSQVVTSFKSILETEKANEIHGQVCRWAMKGGNVNLSHHRKDEAEIFGPMLAENLQVEASVLGLPTQRTVFKPFKKTSQKQRRRMEQTAATHKNQDGVENNLNSQHVVPNAWGNVGSPLYMEPRSFWSVMKEQSEKSSKPNSTITVKPVPLAVSPTKAAPDGPWQQIPSHSSQKTGESAEENASASLRDIIQSEIHSVAKLQRQQSKPMHLIQLEDRAMAEIKDYYEKNSSTIDKQYFTVERM